MRKKKKSKHILSWIFSVFCFTTVLAYGFCLGSILFLAMGIMALLIQPIRNLWNKIPVKPNVIRPIILSVAFFVAIMTLAETSAEQTDNSGIESNVNKENVDDKDDSVEDNSTADDESGTDNNGGTVIVPAVPSATPELPSPWKIMSGQEEVIFRNI